VQGLDKKLGLALDAQLGSNLEMIIHKLGHYGFFVESLAFFFLGKVHHHQPGTFWRTG
jgi:hypothetical protein